MVLPCYRIGVGVPVLTLEVGFAIESRTLLTASVAGDIATWRNARKSRMRMLRVRILCMKALLLFEVMLDCPMAVQSADSAAAG
jgi:hypothetical protein